MIFGGTANSTWNTLSFTYVDSPASTSSITYAVYFKTGTGTTYIGQGGTVPSTITLMEIAA